jgi:hypothetical protein
VADAVITTTTRVHYRSRVTHLALDNDAPDLRTIELSGTRKIVQLPEVGGLHHRYVRRAASPCVACPISVNHRELAETVHNPGSEDEPCPGDARRRQYAS